MQHLCILYTNQTSLHYAFRRIDAAFVHLQLWHNFYYGTTLGTCHSTIIIHNEFQNIHEHWYWRIEC